MKTVVLGLGNPILTDDAAGLQVAEAIRARVSSSDVTVLETGLGSLNLLELLVGYDNAIIVDAIQTREGKPGEIYRLSIDSLQTSRHIDSVHSVSLATTIQIGKSLGIAMPSEITIFAIEAENVNTFGEDCTPAVKKAVISCADKIARMIGDRVELGAK